MHFFFFIWLTQNKRSCLCVFVFEIWDIKTIDCNYLTRLNIYHFFCWSLAIKNDFLSLIIIIIICSSGSIIDNLGLLLPFFLVPCFFSKSNELSWFMMTRSVYLLWSVVFCCFIKLWTMLLLNWDFFFDSRLDRLLSGSLYQFFYITILVFHSNRCQLHIVSNWIFSFLLWLQLQLDLYWIGFFAIGIRYHQIDGPWTMD